jgi:hypothetical protein
MKKHLSIGLSVALSAVILTGMAHASSTFDELSYNPTSPTMQRSRQSNYLDALLLRYKNMYNKSQQDRDYNNKFIQQDRMEQLKKENHIEGNLGSDMNRTGEMEQDKERVRTVDENRVQAVNAKQTFRKAAINYYVDGGAGYSDSAAMEVGNVDGMNNQVARRQTLGEMYKINVGATNLTTRDMVRNLGLNLGNGVTKPSTFYKGGFTKTMSSPYMSTKWME